MNQPEKVIVAKLVDGSFTFVKVDKAEAKVIMREAQVNMTCKWVQNGNNFVLSDGQVEKLRKWLETQSRLHDGCIEFLFCPCAMGIVIKVTNSLTHEEIDLTEYE